MTHSETGKTLEDLEINSLKATFQELCHLEIDLEWCEILFSIDLRLHVEYIGQYSNLPPSLKMDTRNFQFHG